MLEQMIRDAWGALERRRSRSLLTMAGIVWGIVAVTMLISYGSGFRAALVGAFNAFGKSVVIAWPQQTSQQPGGQRAGRQVRFEQADLEAVRQKATLVKHACLETVRRFPITNGDRLVDAAIRGVCPEYGEMRHEIPSQGRWINADDFYNHRRVAFLGGKIREQLFSGMPAVSQEVRINGVTFTVVGVMTQKIQLSNYFASDDRSVFIPYTAAGDVWDTRYASVMVFEPVAAQFEMAARQQVLAAVAERQQFSATDQKAIQMFGREEFRPIIDGITIGIQVLLLFIGTLTLGIGGVGLMNIMLVSVDERIREIGLRRALGATRAHIRGQFLAEALLIVLSGGAVGILISYLLALVLPTLPLLGPLFQDTSGRGDIHLGVSLLTVVLAFAVLMLVGVLSGLAPALRASHLDPVEALRYE